MGRPITEWDTEGHPLHGQPTRHLPRSTQKVEEMARRYQDHKALFNPLDAKVPEVFKVPLGPWPNPRRWENTSLYWSQVDEELNREEEK